MAGTPCIRKKAFFIEGAGSGHPSLATLQSCPNPRGDGIPAEVLKLTMPDGSEWYVTDDAWSKTYELVMESREHYLSAKG